MRSPLLTWKPWYWICALIVCAVLAKVIHPLLARVLFVALVVLIAWSFWELGAELFRRLPSKHALNLGRFRLGLFYILGYFAIIIWFPSDEFLLNNYSPGAYGWRWAIWPVGMGLLYFFFYDLYFLSKAMSMLRKQADLDEPVFLYVLLFWLFPVGIFVLQPRFAEVLSNKSS